MPPKRSIHVDRLFMLRTVARIAAKHREDVLADPWGECNQAEKLSDAEWVRRDLAYLAGKTLTASERIRHQQAMVAMENEGLLVRDGRWCKLTPAGLAAVEGKVDA